MITSQRATSAMPVPSLQLAALSKMLTGDYHGQIHNDADDGDGAKEFGFPDAVTARGPW